MAASRRDSQPKLLYEVRQVLRLSHYAGYTERSYVAWIIRYTRLHTRPSRAGLFPTKPKIEAFLADLAMPGNVATFTQDSVGNTLVFHYNED